MKCHKQSGSTFIVVLILMVVLTALVGAAYEYTTSLQRNVQRSVAMLQAQAIGNAAIEVEYAQWKQIYASQQTQILPADTASTTGTYFRNIKKLEDSTVSGTGVWFNNTGTSNVIGASSTNWRSGGWTITNYGIVAADYNFAVSSSGTPSRCYDVQPPLNTTNSSALNNGSSYYYIARADVSMPTVSGTITVRVQRIFRKQYVNPFQYAIYYNDPLEINPGATFGVTGKVFTNKEMWINSSVATFNDKVSFGGIGYYPAYLEYINGTPSPNTTWSGSDPRYDTRTGSNPATFKAGSPTQQNTQSLYGVASSDPANGNPNNIYHDLIDPPPGVLGMTATSGYLDPFDNSAAYNIDPLHNPQNFRFYNNADVVVYTNSSGVLSVITSNGTATTLGSGTYSVTYPPTSGSTWLTATVTGSSVTYSGTTVSSIPYIASGTNSTAALVNAALEYSALMGGTLTVTGTLPGYNLSGTNVIKFTPYGTTGSAGTTGTAAIATTNGNPTATTITDNRQGVPVNLTTVNVGNMAANLNSLAPIISNTTDMVYFRDARNGTVTYDSYGVVTGTTGSVSAMKAYKLTGGSYIPLPSLTLASNNPVYVQGDYNTNGTPLSNTSTTGTSYNTTSHTNQFSYASLSGTLQSPQTTSGVTNNNYASSPPSTAIVADAITVLSNNWSDANSSASLSSRNPTATTINSAFLSGQVPTVNGNYSGGVENFPRFLENWSGSIPFTYVGSIVELFKSNQAYKKWPGTGGNFYNAPQRVWSFDVHFLGAPPSGFNSSIKFQRYKWDSYLIQSQ
jgi:hypothetical protein